MPEPGRQPAASPQECDAVSAAVDAAAAALFAGPGEMRARCRALDWATTPLGPVDGWPASLQTAVGICLGSRFPMAVFWGPALALIYNDAHRAALGAKHPAALGRPASEMWAEHWPETGPKLTGVLAGEPADWHEDEPLTIALEAGPDGAPEVATFTYSLSPIPDGLGGVGGVLNTAVETTARVRAEQAFRAAEARHAFLLALSDALRPLDDPAAVQRAATRVVGEHLGADRVLYAEVMPDGDSVVITDDFVTGDLPKLVGRFPVNSFDATFGALRAGRTLVMSDVAVYPGLGEAERVNIAALGPRALVVVPLVKHGRWVSNLGVYHGTPRGWTADEVQLLEDAAERTWAAVERARAESALKASEERYRALVDTLPGAAAFVVGHDLCYQLAAGEAFRAAGFAAEQFVGRPLAAVVDGDAKGEYEANVRRALAGEPFEIEHAVHGRVFLTRGVPLRDGAGEVDAALAVSVDVTARRLAEAGLRASEARYRTLVENLRDYAIFLLDPAGVIVEWTPGAERVKGWTAAEAVGQHLSLCYTPEDVAAGRPERELAVAAAAGHGEWEAWRVRKDGSRFWADEIATAVRDRDGALVGFSKITRDLTERRLAEAAAERAQLAAARDAQRRALAAAEEAERRRLARELHDQLGQELTAFRLGLDDAARLAAEHVPLDAPLLGRLTQLGALAQRMTAGARYLALELRPPELDDVGFESALATYVAEWAARYGVPAEVAVTGPAAHRPVPAEVGSALYRIVQEALTNVAKHAGATQVSVIVENPDGGDGPSEAPLGEVRLIVEDDGRGFEVESTAERVRRERRLGLAGMRERAALVGGTVAIESSPGAGTTVYVRLPVGGVGGGGGAPPTAAA